jgi:hypothetical protein
LGIPSTRRNKNHIDGYVPTSSEERVATSGDKVIQWGYGEEPNTSEPSVGDLEMGNRYITSSARGGGGENVGCVSLRVEHTELGGWEDDRANPSKKGQIVKTVHIDQSISGPWVAALETPEEEMVTIRKLLGSSNDADLSSLHWL